MGDDNASGEDVTILEFTCDIVVTNEPLKFVLVYTIGHAITEAIDERIQTRFGGVRLPSTVKDLEELITDSSNVVAMEKHFGLSTFLTVGNTGVGILPINVVMNSITHLLFDLTHVWCRLVDFYTIQEMGALTTPCVPLVRLSPPKHLFKQRGIIETLLIKLIISQPDLLFDPCTFGTFLIKLLTKFEQLLVTFSDSQIGSIPDDSYTIHHFDRLSANSGHFN